MTHLARILLNKLLSLVAKIQRLRLCRAVRLRFRPTVRVCVAGPEETGRVLNAILPSPAEFHSHPEVTPYVAYLGERPAGYVELLRRDSLARDASTYWLYSLFVPGRYRGLGIGEDLCQAVIAAVRAEKAPAVTLFVHPQNFPARSLYHKLGFQIITDEQELNRLQPENDSASSPIVMRKYLA